MPQEEPAAELFAFLMAFSAVIRATWLWVPVEKLELGEEGNLMKIVCVSRGVRVGRNYLEEG